MVRLFSQAKYVGTVSRYSGYDEAVMCVPRVETWDTARTPPLVGSRLEMVPPQLGEQSIRSNKSGSGRLQEF